MYRDGMSAEEIAEMECIAISTVYESLNACGVPFKRGGSKPKGCNERRAALHAQGLTVPEIAEREHVTEKAVYKSLRLAGVNLAESIKSKG